MWLLTAFATVSLFSQASGYLSFGSHQGLFEVEKREYSSQNDGTNWSCVSAVSIPPMHWQPSLEIGLPNPKSNIIF